MRLEFHSTELLESSGYNKTLKNPIGEATDDWVPAYLCHVVDYVGTIGYCDSAEQGLSGCREEHSLPRIKLCPPLQNHFCKVC